MSENILTEHDCMQVLYRRFSRVDVKLLNYEIKPLSEQIQGFCGDHYKIDINYELDGEEKVEHFFLKTKPTRTNAQKEMVLKLNVFQKELFIYDYVLQEFEKYGFDTSFAPKYYYSAPNESIILENITLRGFCLPEMYKVYDVEQCKCGLRALALLHADGYMYEEVKTKELGRPFRWNVEQPANLEKELFFSSEGQSFGLKWFDTTREVFLALIDCLPESETYKEKFKHRLKKAEFGRAFREEHNIRKTILHSDLWSNNMMFISEDGVAKQCCLFDYQSIRYYYPAFDVIMFIYTCTTREFRQKHWAKLSKFYYTNLSNILSDGGHAVEDIFPEEDYEASLEIVELEAKMHSFACQSEWCYSQEYLSDLIKSGDENINDLWFGDRSPQIVQSFKSDENYRKLMTGCMYDLHDTFFKN